MVEEGIVVADEGEIQSFKYNVWSAVNEYSHVEVIFTDNQPQPLW